MISYRHRERLQERSARCRERESYGVSERKSVISLAVRQESPDSVAVVARRGFRRHGSLKLHNELPAKRSHPLWRHWTATIRCSSPYLRVQALAPRCRKSSCRNQGSSSRRRRTVRSVDLNAWSRGSRLARACSWRGNLIYVIVGFSTLPDRPSGANAHCGSERVIPPMLNCRDLHAVSTGNPMRVHAPNVETEHRSRGVP